MIEALEGWKTCMEEHGVGGVSYELELNGNLSTGYSFSGTAEPSAAEENEVAGLDAYCNASYVGDLWEYVNR